MLLSFGNAMNVAPEDTFARNLIFTEVGLKNGEIFTSGPWKHCPKNYIPLQDTNCSHENELL